jgi:Zn-finger nucleic acid-binding protein
MLVALDRNGVTVDACPCCRGIWVDRGELDELIDLEAARSDDFTDEFGGTPRETESDDRGGKHSFGHGSTKRRVRGGFLGDMFDFG